MRILKFGFETRRVSRCATMNPNKKIYLEPLSIPSLPRTTVLRRSCVLKNATTGQGPEPTSPTAVSVSSVVSEHGETKTPRELSSTNETRSGHSTGPVSEDTSDKIVKVTGDLKTNFLSKFPKRLLPKTNVTSLTYPVSAGLHFNWTQNEGLLNLENFIAGVYTLPGIKENYNIGKPEAKLKAQTANKRVKCLSKRNFLAQLQSGKRCLTLTVRETRCNHNFGKVILISCVCVCARILCAFFNDFYGVNNYWMLFGTTGFSFLLIKSMPTIECARDLPPQNERVASARAQTGYVHMAKWKPEVSHFFANSAKVLKSRRRKSESFGPIVKDDNRIFESVLFCF